MFAMSKQEWAPPPRPWVWEEIKLLLERTGISLAEFGRRVGAKRNQIGNWKRAKSVPDKAAAAVARELGRTADWVMNGQEARATSGFGQRLVLRFHKYDPVRLDTIYDHVAALDARFLDLPEEAQSRLVISLYKTNSDNIDKDAIRELIDIFVR